MRCPRCRPRSATSSARASAWIAAFLQGALDRRAGAARHLLPAGRDAGRRLLHARRLGPHGRARSMPGCRAPPATRSARIARDIDRAIAGFVRGQALGLPHPRHLLRGRPGAGRAEFRRADRHDRRHPELHPLCRLAHRPDPLGRRRHRAVLAGLDHDRSRRSASSSFGQFVEGNILSPKLVGDSVGLHPVWLMFALLAFGVAVRLRRPAARGAARGRHRRARALRPAAVSGEPALPRHGAADPAEPDGRARPKADLDA